MNTLHKLSIITGLALAGTASAQPVSGGTVLIAAPSALDGPTNAGVWFVDPATKAFSLDLADLGQNEVYEGWIVDDCTGRKTSTGLFRSTGGIDSDSGGRFAGPLALNVPSQPGSDFVTLGGDLADGGHHIVVTIEPYPDADPAPSGRAVLRATIPADVAVGTELVLETVKP